MSAGARTPDELEALLEDALVLGDRSALLEIFEARAIVVTAPGTELRGRDEIATLMDEPFVGGGPHRIVQAGRTALLLGQGSISVVRRGRDAAWRYAISIRQLDVVATVVGVRSMG